MYTRVSTKGQVKDGYGQLIQVKDCRAWARAAGHTIVQHCDDPARTGTLPPEQRPGLSCALNALETGAADGMVCGRLDRLARELTVQEAALALAWRQRTGGREPGRVFCADQGEVMRDDPDDPVRTAMRQMMGVFAQLDRAMAVQRMRKGRLAKAAAGKHAVGVYPYGTQPGGEGRDRDAVPHEGEQAAVALIVRLRREGRSYRQVTAALDEAGMAPRNGRTWYPSTVRKIAQREGLS
jgi:DNA invertase Pin-like site-specific DNA recombinase